MGWIDIANRCKHCNHKGTKLSHVILLSSMQYTSTIQRCYIILVFYCCSKTSLQTETFLKFIFIFYSVTIVCIFSPSLHPSPANPTSLSHLYPPPRFCPCVLYSSSCRPLSPLSPPHSPLAIVTLFLISMCLVIFCLLFSFVDYVPKLKLLKATQMIIQQIWKSDVQNQFLQDENQGAVRSGSLLKPQHRIYSIAFSASRTCLHLLACGPFLHIQTQQHLLSSVTTASMFTSSLSNFDPLASFL